MLSATYNLHSVPYPLSLLPYTLYHILWGYYDEEIIGTLPRVVFYHAKCLLLLIFLFSDHNFAKRMQNCYQAI